MYKKIEFLFLVILLITLITISGKMENYVSSSAVDAKKIEVVLDPGHGDSDPGKIGINQALEKDINLSIAKKVQSRLKKEGVQVLMTRENDEMLAKESDTNKKIQDMKARVQLMNESSPKLVVSIHQNSYTDERIHGAQVFYYAQSAEGKEVAEIMQKALLKVDESNKRQAKPESTYYILKRTKPPTIIVECGFLSNSEEAELLVSDDYQEKLADAITAGILACLSK
mgnify:CR=1 FL=1